MRTPPLTKRYPITTDTNPEIGRGPHKIVLSVSAHMGDSISSLSNNQAFCQKQSDNDEK